MTKVNVIHIKSPFDRLPDINPSVLAIGYFDGVHLGHQEVIVSAKKIARQKEAQVGVMTFHPHPREVLGFAKYNA